MNTVYDIIIIGGGSAGVSAALTALNRGKSVAVVTNPVESSNLYKAEWVTNYPGFEGKSGRELAGIFFEQLEKSSAHIIRGRALSIIPFGDSYNITGNFFDRSFGPALELGSRDTIGVSLVTVTGNIFRRSGAHEKNFEDPEHNSHVLLTNCSNMVVTNNTMRVGRNDGGGGVLSPDYGFIIKDCKDCIIKDNTMMTGAKKELMKVSSNNNCIIESNIGSLADENTQTASPLLN